MLRACGMIPWASSAGSRTSIRIGVWVGEGEADGRVAVICFDEVSGAMVQIWRLLLLRR
jgi:hypothetical protein